MTQPSDKTPDITAIFNDIVKFREKYRVEVIVIKFGGALAEEDDTIRNIGKQAAFLAESVKARVIVVHGGGKQIDNALLEKNIEPKKDTATGLRITDLPTLDVSDSALRALNGKIVRLFQEASTDFRAVGMAGYDGQLAQAEKLNHYTGEATEINVKYLNHLLDYDAGVIPVIYPICKNQNADTGETRLNVNADNLAAEIASQMKARRLVLCSDIPGVLDKDGNLLTGLTSEDIDKLIDDGTVTGGMTAKLKSAAKAVEILPSGGVVILDGRKDNAILTEFLYEKGAGTLIRPAKKGPKGP